MRQTSNILIEGLWYIGIAFALSGAGVLLAIAWRAYFGL